MPKVAVLPPEAIMRLSKLLGMAPRQPPPKRSPPEVPGWMKAAKECIEAHDENEFGPNVTAWEHTFLTDIMERGGNRLSDKQMAVLRRIADKMHVALDE